MNYKDIEIDWMKQILRENAIEIEKLKKAVRELLKENQKYEERIKRVKVLSLWDTEKLLEYISGRIKF